MLVDPDPKDRERLSLHECVCVFSCCIFPSTICFPRWVGSSLFPAAVNTCSPYKVRLFAISRFQGVSLPYSMFTLDQF